MISTDTSVSCPQHSQNAHLKHSRVPKNVTHNMTHETLDYLTYSTTRFSNISITYHTDVVDMGSSAKEHRTKAFDLPTTCTYRADRTMLCGSLLVEVRQILQNRPSAKVLLP